MTIFLFIIITFIALRSLNNIEVLIDFDGTIAKIITAITLMAVLTTGAIAAPSHKEDTCPTKQEQDINSVKELISNHPTGCVTTIGASMSSTVTTHSGVMSRLELAMAPLPSRSIHLPRTQMESGHANCSPPYTQKTTVLQKARFTVYTVVTVTVHASFLASRASNTTQDPLLYVGAVGLLILTLTMWVAVKRCPLFMKGGIMAIIALVLSLFVAVTPVAASPTFEAIDANSIELAWSPAFCESTVMVGEQVQTCPQMRKLRTGEWSCAAGSHASQHGFMAYSSSSTASQYSLGAVVAITAIAASFVCPTESMGIEGVAMCAPASWASSIGLFFAFTPEGQEDTMSVVTTRGRVLQHCKSTGVVGKVETKALANNTFDFIMKSLNRQDVFSADITTRADKKAVQAAFPGSLVLQGKRNNFTVIFGMSVEEYCDFLDTEITNKLGLKYMGGLFARVTGAGHSTPKIAIIDLPSGGDGDGILRYSDTEQLLQLGVALGDDITNIRAKIWHSEAGLIKGLFVLVHDTSVDCLTIETCLEDNQKGCLQGPALALGVDAVVHAWTQAARPKAKAANTSPMMLAQLGNASYDACVPAAEASLEEDANRMIDAILHGTMDEAMFEGTGGDVSNQIIARDELRSLLNQAELPVGSFGSLLRYLKPLIENWKGDLGTLQKACEKRAVAFRMPHSSISVVLSEGTFRRYCELTKPGEFVPFERRGIISMYSDSIRMTVVCEEYYDRVISNGLWDIGDNDGDTHVNAAIEVDGVETSLVHRWPAGAGDFDLLEPKRVDVPLHNKSARRLDGSIVELEPLNFSDETDCINLVDIEVHEDEHLPKGKLNADNFEAWQDTLEKNVDAAFKIGTYALLQTSLMSHDKKAVLPRCEFVVDGDIQGTSCVATSQEVDKAMKPAMTAFNEGDIVDSAMFAWARMGLNNYTLDPREAKKKVLLRGVEGSFTRLAKAMVAKRNECAKWLRDRYAEILKGGQRNSQPIIAACEAAGLVADLDKGQRGVAYVNAGNSLALLRRLDEMDPRAAAEAVYSMYLYIDGQKGMFDSALFHCPESFPGTKYQTVAAYLVAYLIDGEGPNPDGDGPSTETQTETQTETTESQQEMEEYRMELRLSSNDHEGFLQSVYEDDTDKINRAYEELAAEEDAIKNRVEKLEDSQLIMLLKQLMKHEKCWVDSYFFELMVVESRPGWVKEISELACWGWKLENIEQYIDNNDDDNDDDDDDDNPTPPDGGRVGPSEEDIDKLTLHQLRELIRKEGYVKFRKEGDLKLMSREHMVLHLVSQKLHDMEAAGHILTDMQKHFQNNEVLNVYGKEVGQLCIGCLNIHSHVPKHSHPRLTPIIFCESCGAMEAASEIRGFIEEFEDAGEEVPAPLLVNLKRLESIDTSPAADEAGKTETEAEASVRIFEAMVPQILEEKAEYEAQKEEEAKMAKKKKTALVKEWAENGKAVQLKRNNQGIYFFVVDGGMRWIPQSLLSEEDSKNIEKVRSVYGQGKKMFAQGVVGTLFKSLGLAALLFAALFGLDAQEGSMHMCTSICFLTQEWDKVRTRIIYAMKRLTGAERDYDKAISCGCPEEEIQDKLGMISLYQGEIDKGFEALEQVEHAMDNQALDEVHGKKYQSKQVEAKWPTKCGAQKHHWIATHPECRPGSCSRPMEPNIGRKAPLKVWWQ